ncbi:MAG: peptidoglycan editing factor PgeF [Alphaproteobacteria bacterium]|jgi:YfiH family protein|nr:peptidoglycan editing factor PgeF [Alphaproteobacteria bacterium]
MITLGVLNGVAGLRHGFFTRQGGVSAGIYASKNCGFGSGDAAANVARNRDRCLEQLDAGAEALLTVHQTHSPDVVTVERPWAPPDAPKADAMVTGRPGVALGVLAADCAPVLFCDPAARVIGAAHAGWKGALGGVLEATVAAMTALGAERGRILAAIGPRIAVASYEVGAEFRERFLAADPANAAWFRPGRALEKCQFDLGGYVAARLGALGLARIEPAPNDTVAEEDRFFSYRRSCHRGEPDYGRNLSAIALQPG